MQNMEEMSHPTKDMGISGDKEEPRYIQMFEISLCDD